MFGKVIRAIVLAEIVVGALAFLMIQAAPVAADRNPALITFDTPVVDVSGAIDLR